MIPKLEDLLEQLCRLSEQIADKREMALTAGSVYGLPPSQYKDPWMVLFESREDLKRDIRRLYDKEIMELTVQHAISDSVFRSSRVDVRPIILQKMAKDMADGLLVRNIVHFTETPTSHGRVLCLTLKVVK